MTCRLAANRQSRTWALAERRAHLQADLDRQQRNTAAAAASQPLEYFYRSLYLPEQGMFCQLPADFRLGHIAEVRISVICDLPGKLSCGLFLFNTVHLGGETY